MLPRGYLMERSTARGIQVRGPQGELVRQPDGRVLMLELESSPGNLAQLRRLLRGAGVPQRGGGR
jgi:hypothetical protein